MPKSLNEAQAALPLGARLRFALDEYERRSGRRPSLQSVDPRQPLVLPVYQAFGRSRLRLRIEPSRGEWLALELGLRPMLRLLVDPGSWTEMRARYQARGFFTRTVQQHYEQSPTTGELAAPHNRPAHCIAFVGTNEDQLEEAATLDSNLLVPGAPRHPWSERTRHLGALLGYPPCCTARFASLEARNTNRESILTIANASSRFDPLLNNVSMSIVHAISWFPCTYDCQASLRIAKRIDRALHDRYGRAHALARRVWAMPRLYLDDRRQLLFDGVMNGNEVLYRSVHHPFAFDGCPNDALVDWIFYADVVHPLLASKRALLRDGTLQTTDAAGTRRDVNLGGIPIRLPFA